jgi:hypothetical protein
MRKANPQRATIRMILVLIGEAIGSTRRGRRRGRGRRLALRATPGIRDLLEYGGHGLLVFDIDDWARFVKPYPDRRGSMRREAAQREGGLRQRGHDRVHISTIEDAHLLDLVTEDVLWERAYPGGATGCHLARRKVIYLPRWRETTGTSSKPSTAT